jgi:phosphoglycerate dehydrogenase-like enzyme
MPDYAKIVAAREWTNKLPIQSIRGNTFTLLGTGNIGQTVAKRLRAMGAARIVGISRSGNAVTDDFDEVFPVSRLDEILPKTYHLIMAMPGTAETAGILSRERIARMPQGACIVNVGRGSAIDQEALIEALNSGKLGGAALDVMMPEPLPVDHPLWNAKNVIITPHVSGNMSLEYTCDAAVELFCEDLRRYAAGLPMENIVDRKLGY